MNISITVTPDPITGFFNIVYTEKIEEQPEPLTVSLLTLSVPETMKTVADLLASYIEVRVNATKKQEQRTMDGSEV